MRLPSFWDRLKNLQEQTEGEYLKLGEGILKDGRSVGEKEIRKGNAESPK